MSCLQGDGSECLKVQAKHGDLLFVLEDSLALTQIFPNVHNLQLRKPKVSSTSDLRP